jgi:hypothetical protein
VGDVSAYIVINEENLLFYFTENFDILSKIIRKMEGMNNETYRQNRVPIL